MLSGNADQWLDHFVTLEERVAAAVEAVWLHCIAPLQSQKGSMTHEDYITNHLVNWLKKSRSVPGRIVPQYALLTPALNGIIQLTSKIDFVVTIGDDEDVYLACECKRLNVPYKGKVRSLASEYVAEGLARFVTCQYANGLPVAMMIGYVMDGQLPVAHGRLKKALHRSRVVALVAEDHSLAHSGQSIRFCTTHNCVGGQKIDVRHTLLGWSWNSSNSD